MDHPCSDGGPISNKSDVSNLMKDVPNLMNKVLNLINDVPNFVKDVSKVPECVPRWE